VKAVYIDSHGGPEMMRYGDLADPVAGAGEVVIDVHAASINAADWKSRRGLYHQAQDFPHVLGRDFSGVVGEVGEGVDDLLPGEAVFGVCELGREGAYAEKIAVASAIVAPKPDSISHTEAAAVALAGLTAVVAIEDTLRLKPDETILVQGGAGGVGSFAVQLAKHIGAHVITTARTVNHDYVRGLGADQAIDYEGRDFTREVADCDAVFDTVGGSVAVASFSVLKPGGRAAFIASGVEAPASTRDDVVALRPHVGRRRAHLERIVDLIDTGAVRVPEIEVYPLPAAGHAHAVSEARHVRGKLVLQVRD